MFSSHLFAQEMAVTTQLYDEENGLSRYANFIHKDGRDQIWVGTQFGLYRFDGRDFTHFDEKNGLPFRQVMEIYEDAEGWFWLYRSCLAKPNCEPDLAFFHPLSQEVLTFEERFGQEVSIKPHQIKSIAVDSSRNIYLTANKKLLIWNNQSMREIALKDCPETPILLSKVSERIFTGLLLDAPNNNFKILSFDITGQIIQTTKANDFFNPYALYYLKRNFFHFNTFQIDDYQMTLEENGQIHITDTPVRVATTTAASNHFNGDILINQQGQYFHKALGILPATLSMTSATRIQAGKAPLILFKNKEDVSYQLFDQAYGSRCIFYDKATQTTWSAESAGIVVRQYQPNKFKVIVNNIEKGAVSKDSEQLGVTVAAVGDSLVFLGFQSKLYVYQKQTRSLRLLDKGNLLNGYIGQLVKHAPTNTVWGTYLDRLFTINQSNLRVKDQPIRLKDIHQRGLFPLDSLSSQWLIYSEKEGLLVYDNATQQVASFPSVNGAIKFQDRKIHFVKNHDAQHFWIATDNGIYWASKKEGLLTHYGPNEQGIYQLPVANIFHIVDAKAGGFWLATRSGLVHWIPPPLAMDTTEVGVRQIVNTTHGLPTNELLAAYEDDYGFVWMPTPQGLIQWQIETGFSKTYQKEDGLSHGSFQEYAHTQTADGTLYFGSYQGFTTFHPKDFKDVNFNPENPLIITEYEQHTNATDKIENRLKEITQAKSITLQPGDKFFNIRVALADYRGATKHRFLYKIEGYQKEWQEDRSNLIRISGLPYGQYTLKIQGRVGDGQLTKPILAIPIKVLKPFYLQNWFFFTVTLLGAIGIYSFNYRRTKNLKERQKELEKSIYQATATIRQKNEQLEQDKQTIEQQAQELRQLDQVKSRFFANVSHELRTPLTLILGPISSLLKTGNLNKKNQALAELSKTNAQNLLKLTNEILDLTKMESGKIELVPTATELHPFLFRIKEAYVGIAEQKNIQYTFAYHGSTNLRLELDTKKTEKIINNLLSNAFKFTPIEGTIELDAQVTEDRFVLSVQDSGRGIHPQDLPYVFDRFFQSSQPDVPKEGGTGIGLSLAQEFTKLMNGRLWAISTLGQGSTFFFEIPIIPAIAPTVTNTTNEPMPAKEVLLSPFPLEPRTIKAIPTDTPILLVEDNEHLRTYIEIILGNRYNFTIAENGRVAWAFLDRQLATSNQVYPDLSGQPALIISDIMMPEMDGYQLLDKLKNDDRFRAIPVIMLTALAELKDKLKALRIGVDDYMTKPFEEEELIARIDNLLRNSQMRKAFYQAQNGTANGNTPPPTKSAESAAVLLSQEDAQWLTDLEKIVKKELGDFAFNVERLAQRCLMSRRKLERKLKSLTGLTPAQYIQEIRYAEARYLLETKSVKSVKDVVYQIGIKDTTNFSRTYKKRFGRLPSSHFAAT